MRIIQSVAFRDSDCTPLRTANDCMQNENASKPGMVASGYLPTPSGSAAWHGIDGFRQQGKDRQAHSALALKVGHAAAPNQC